MSVAFEDKEMWFKYALSLISARKYARGIIVLRECAKLDPTNYLYHSLIARVALQNIREPLVAIESLEKALEASGKSADMTCYDEAKIYLLMAVAYAMKAESSTVNISDKNQAWEAARNHFAKWVKACTPIYGEKGRGRRSFIYEQSDKQIHSFRQSE